MGSAHLRRGPHSSRSTEVRPGTSPRSMASCRRQVLVWPLTPRSRARSAAAQRRGGRAHVDGIRADSRVSPRLPPIGDSSMTSSSPTSQMSGHTNFLGTGDEDHVPGWLRGRVTWSRHCEPDRRDRRPRDPGRHRLRRVSGQDGGNRRNVGSIIRHPVREERNGGTGQHSPRRFRRSLARGHRCGWRHGSCPLHAGPGQGRRTFHACQFLRFIDARIWSGHIYITIWCLSVVNDNCMRLQHI